MCPCRVKCLCRCSEWNGVYIIQVHTRKCTHSYDCAHARTQVVPLDNRLPPQWKTVLNMADEGVRWRRCKLNSVQSAWERCGGMCDGFICALPTILCRTDPHLHSCGELTTLCAFPTRIQFPDTALQQTTCPGAISHHSGQKRYSLLLVGLFVTLIRTQIFVCWGHFPCGLFLLC